MSHDKSLWESMEHDSLILMRGGQQQQLLNRRSKQRPPLLQGRKIFRRREALLSDSLSCQDFAPRFDAGAAEENFSSGGELLSMRARDARRSSPS
ncbi:hypothetical protein OJAV_G00139830 [Oryzias javanicus]|uniref:Uncharacterized protein n=1 Tax=Oryzias javanicus TaxID=123683 RepID=A0A437CLW1_ORYJA|nr:hypothetical protein OJAV_G00139830 [Oryzias javanicus]